MNRDKDSMPVFCIKKNGYKIIRFNVIDSTNKEYGFPYEEYCYG